MWIVALAFLTLTSVGLRAQMNPIAFTEYDLPNGLHVILHEDHSAPVVATVVHYKVGSRDEDPKRTGFAHFFEHLMFESTPKIERGQLDQLIRGVGGSLNAFTSFDKTVYHFVVPSSEVRLALWIEAQRMRGLQVNQVGVETQRGVVKEERKVRYDNAPYGAWNEKAMKGLYGGTPYGWTPIGSSQHIDSAAISEFQDFYNMFYQPNNAILVVSGDFDPAVVKKTIDAYFGGFTKAPEAKRPTFTLTSLGSEKRETIDDPRAQLPAVFIAMRGLSLTDTDMPALALLESIMSDGESSRLTRSIVDSQQIAVNTGFGMNALEYGGLLYCVGISAPGKDIGAVEKAIYAELQRVADKGVTAEELDKAKNIAESRQIMSLTGVYEKALALADAYRFEGKTSTINTDIEKIMKVTTADVQRVAKKLFGTSDRIVITYLPKRS